MREGGREYKRGSKRGREGVQREYTCADVRTARAHAWGRAWPVRSLRVSEVSREATRPLIVGTGQRDVIRLDSRRSARILHAKGELPRRSWPETPFNLPFARPCDTIRDFDIGRYRVCDAILNSRIEWAP